MSDHNLSGRVWATAALVAVPLMRVTNLGWWLPLHLALLGTITQVIVGGQLMFSATLGLSRGPSRRVTLTQLALLNLGAILVISGRLWDSRTALALGGTTVTLTIVWVLSLVDRLWRHSVNRRFTITGTFYRLAGVCIIFGAAIGAALGIGAFGDASSYANHRSVHMVLNVLGWAGLTMVGTAITLLPTILHVRAPKLRALRAIPWLMFGGLTVLATGNSIGFGPLAGVGMASYAAGLATFAVYVRKVLATPRRRQVPTAALHLVAALAWLGFTALSLVVVSTTTDHTALRDLVVVGGAGGFAFQAVLGAWSFLLPSTRAPLPELRRRELVAMELGGRAQVIVYNIGLVAVLVGLRSGINSALVGTVCVWSAAAWALAKSWGFPLLASMPTVRERSERWWAEPER